MGQCDTHSNGLCRQRTAKQSQKHTDYLKFRSWTNSRSYSSNVKNLSPHIPCALITTHKGEDPQLHTHTHTRTVHLHCRLVRVRSALSYPMSCSKSVQSWHSCTALGMRLINHRVHKLQVHVGLDTEYAVCAELVLLTEVGQKWCGYMSYYICIPQSQTSWPFWLSWSPDSWDDWKDKLRDVR